MIIESLAPIVLFVYNRPWHTEQTLEALMNNELASESILYIYCDGHKENSNDEEKIRTVRTVIRKKIWCKEVHIKELEKNKGLANSIIEGVTEIINKYGKIIVLEDDLITHKFFLRFMNEALNFYKSDFRIFSVAGTNYRFNIPKSYTEDVYIVHRSESCGWGSWLNRWDKADWNVSDFRSLIKSKRKRKKFNRGGNDMLPMLKSQIENKIDSWAIRWDYCMYKNNAYCLKPVRNLIINIGFDGTGINSGIGDINKLFAISYNKDEYSIKFISNLKPNKFIEKEFKKNREINIPDNRFLIKVINKIKLLIDSYLNA